MNSGSGLVQTLVPDFGPDLVPVGIRNGCPAESRSGIHKFMLLGQTQQRRAQPLVEPKAGFNGASMLLEIDVFDVRVSGQKPAVRKVNYR